MHDKKDYISGEPSDLPPTGLELIITERERQIEVEGFDAAHDRWHTSGELALAAVCYASPVHIYGCDLRYPGEMRFIDPWPDSWDDEWDKRKREELTGRVVANGLLPVEQRIRNLVKAGALIAAEIDRLQRGQ